MQSTKNRKVLAISIGVLIYISIITYFLIAGGKDLIEAILQALVSAVLGGVILWALLKLINKKKNQRHHPDTSDELRRR